MRKFLKYSAAGLLFSVIALPISGLVAAEVRTTSVSQQSADLKHLALPKNGVSKEYVAQKFGEPTKKEAAIGEPPITVWHYDRYSVYFEHNKVIHTVLKKK